MSRSPSQQQTFSHEHWEILTTAFGGSLSTESMRILYRASHSETFAADLRVLLEQIVKPTAL
jgi:hypothetical protein